MEKIFQFERSGTLEEDLEMYDDKVEIIMY